MGLTDYIRILRKSWIVIVVLALVGLGVGAAGALLQRPVYESTALVFVSTSSGDSVGELAQGNNYTLQRVNTYSTLATTRRVLAPVAESLGQTDVDAIAARITATPQADTTIIEIAATGSDPEETAELANAVANSLTVEVQTIEAGDAAEATSPVRLEVVEPAEPARTPVSPKVPLNLAIGFLAGLAVALAIAVLREMLDTKIRGAHTLSQITDISLVGAIAYDSKAKERPLIVHADPLHPRAEAFRALRTNLQFVEVDGNRRSFVVTSSVQGEGKSTTTANLALALADSGQTVILVDADLRRPRVAEYMGLEGRVGLTDVLIDRIELVDAVQQWGTTGKLFVLPAGQIPPNPSELLASKAMEDLIAVLEREFDWVIFDAPPLLPVTDAALLSKRLTGALLAVSTGHVTKHQVESALGVLKKVDAPVAGAILTFVPTRGADAYGAYAYGYGYGYGEGAREDRPRGRTRKGSRALPAR